MLFLQQERFLSNGIQQLTGEEGWRVVRGAESTVPMPISENGIVYFYTGLMVDAESSNFTELLAVNPDGKGDITDREVSVQDWKVKIQRG